MNSTLISRWSLPLRMAADRRGRQRYTAVYDFVTWPEPEHPEIAGVVEFSHGLIVDFYAPNDLSARRRLGKLTPPKPLHCGKWFGSLYRGDGGELVNALRERYARAGSYYIDPQGWG